MIFIIAFIAFLFILFSFGTVFGLLYKIIRYFYRMYRKSSPPTQIEP